MKRQHLKLVALACSAVFGLAACGSSGGSSDSAPNFSGADAGGTIFGNGFAKNNNGSNGNGNNNAGNNANNCGFFGCSPSNPGNNGGGNNNGGSNNNGNANNNNGGNNGGNNNARPAPNFTVNDGIGYYYGEGSNIQYGRNHGYKTRADLLTIKATDDLKTLDIDGFLVNVNGADNTPADKAYNPVQGGGLPNGYNPSNRNDLTYDMRTNSSRALQYSRFGAMERTEYFHGGNTRSEGSFVTSSAFSIGKVTPASSMPTTGTATYSGYAMDDNWRKANFAVDFGAKTVEGRLMSHTDPNIVYYKLSGVINGSSFEGLNTEDRNEIRMRGRFYGPQAAEIGGVYNGIATGAGIMGAFGAAKNNP